MAVDIQHKVGPCGATFDSDGDGWRIVARCSRPKAEQSKSMLLVFLFLFVWTCGILLGFLHEQSKGGSTENYIAFTILMLLGLFFYFVAFATFLGKVVIRCQGRHGMVFEGFWILGRYHFFDPETVVNVLLKHRTAISKKNSNCSFIVLTGPRRIQLGILLRDDARAFVYKSLKCAILQNNRRQQTSAVDNSEHSDALRSPIPYKQAGSLLPVASQKTSARVKMWGETMQVSFKHIWGIDTIVAIVLIPLFSFFCVGLAEKIYQASHMPEIIFFLVLMSFFSFVVVALLNFIFRREELLLGADGIEYMRFLIIPVYFRKVPLAEIDDFDMGNKTYFSRDDLGSVLWQMEMITIGKPLRFGVGMTKLELTRLQRSLRRHLAKLQTNR